MPYIRTHKRKQEVEDIIVELRNCENNNFIIHRNYDRIKYEYLDIAMIADEITDYFHQREIVVDITLKPPIADYHDGYIVVKLMFETKYEK